MAIAASAGVVSTGAGAGSGAGGASAATTGAADGSASGSGAAQGQRHHLFRRRGRRGRDDRRCWLLRRCRRRDRCRLRDRRRCHDCRWCYDCRRCRLGHGCRWRWLNLGDRPAVAVVALGQAEDPEVTRGSRTANCQSQTLAIEAAGRPRPVRAAWTRRRGRAPADGPPASRRHCRGRARHRRWPGRSGRNHGRAPRSAPASASRRLVRPIFPVGNGMVWTDTRAMRPSFSTSGVGGSSRLVSP